MKDLCKSQKFEIQLEMCENRLKTDYDFKPFSAHFGRTSNSPT